jgi:hypothetical protein
MTSLIIYFHDQRPLAHRNTEIPLTLISVYYGRTLNIHIDLIQKPPGADTDFVVQGFREQDPLVHALIDWGNTAANHIVHCLDLPSFGPPNQWDIFPAGHRTSQVFSGRISTR